ncbi:MAG: hypothetical protein ABR905_05215 [Terracidiphilus sp.]|jgi:hypothetical protein
MSCSICGSLERAYEAVLDEYLEARSSARYRVSTVLAAQKNVDMERARYELEEHKRACPSVHHPALIVSRDRPTTPTRSRSMAA